MDSPKVAIHIILEDKINSDNQDIANQNRLYCSIAQPLRSNQSIKYYRSINSSAKIHPSLGMIANQNSLIKSRKQKLTGKSPMIDGNNNTSSAFSGDKMALNENLKKMGWYWGSISPEFATKLLKDEQDGSFLIRDSSSECYIFSMTLKLDNEIHHTRIEHSSGYFSFGRSRKFYCTTMVDFIEQAIECSRTGELSFFLHRGPQMMGPVEFRMIPLSRMNGSNSLKHLCRFAILPYVRKDKIHELCLPECLKDYLYEPFRGNSNLEI